MEISNAISTGPVHPSVENDEFGFFDLVVPSGWTEMDELHGCNVAKVPTVPLGLSYASQVSKL